MKFYKGLILVNVLSSDWISNGPLDFGGDSSCRTSFSIIFGCSDCVLVFQWLKFSFIATN